MCKQMNRSVVSPSPSVNDVGSNLSYLPSGDVQKALEGQNVSGAASQNGCPIECSNHGLFINLKEDADILLWQVSECARGALRTLYGLSGPCDADCHLKNAEK